MKLILSFNTIIIYYVLYVIVQYNLSEMNVSQKNCFLIENESNFKRRSFLRRSKLNDTFK